MNKKKYTYRDYPISEKYPETVKAKSKKSLSDLTIENLNLYKDIIEIYESNSLKISNNKIYINDSITNEYEFKIGKHNLDIKKTSIHSVFILEGKIKQKSNFLTKGTFMKIENIDFLNLEVLEDSKVFEIISPLNPSYKTYSHNR